jgi:methylated-DNA-[protein]-cysteine S-methyltransferase
MGWTELDAAPGLRLRLTAAETGLRAVEFDVSRPSPGERDDAGPLLLEAAAQMRAYFEGRLRSFDLPLDPHGTPFQLRVWERLRSIPYGETRSYGWLAASLGSPRAVRAVGAANGANPLPIVVPCHRVIGASGKLVGYGGGLELKRRLLRLESGSEGLWEG